jgi:hypothetical protein
MRTSLKIVPLLVVSITLLTISGCAKQQVKYSGFLENYPEFGPGRDGGVDLLYLKEGVDFKKYNKVMMDHVVFYFNKDAEYKGINSHEMNKMSEAFHKAFIKELKPYFRVVDKPGPDVMRIRTAVTDIVASKPGLSVTTTIVPTALAFSFVKKAVTGSHTGVGQASIEAEILDSLTNERIGAAIDKRAGKKSEGASEWGAVEGAFEFWAKRLRKWLDETHGIKQ